mgnify:CR=1 FL=1
MTVFSINVYFKFIAVPLTGKFMLYHSGLKKMQQEEVSLDSFYSATDERGRTQIHSSMTIFEFIGGKTSLRESKIEVLCNPQ